VVVDVPLFDLPAERARVREAAAERDAAAHRLESVRIAVAAQVAEAEALLEGARHVDAQSRAIVATAAEARTQAEAQYEAGLVDIGAVTVAVARHREAQLDAVRTRLDVLRAALTRDLARGDLSRWLEEGR
jgi:outer membrane protein TolC